MEVGCAKISYDKMIVSVLAIVKLEISQEARGASRWA